MSDRPLRILHVTAGSDAGGLSRYIHAICSGMTAQGHFTPVAGERGAWHWLFEKDRFPWIESPMKSGPYGLAQAARQLVRLYKRHPKPDLIHSHYRKTTLVARRLQLAWDVPILYTVHQPRISMMWPRRWLSDFGDHCHVASVDAQQWLLNTAYIPPKRVTIIPHGVDTNDFPQRSESDRQAARAALGLPQDATLAAFVGRFDVPKNAHWMIDLAQATRERLPKLHVVMQGEGPEEEEIRERIHAQGLTERVTLLPNGSPLATYQAADSLLSPSLREGFSLASAEAMSVGVPVFRTRTGGTRELIVEGVTGRSVEIKRTAFVERAIEFLSQRESLAVMGENAARHVRENFTFQLQLSRTIELYKQLIDAYRRSPRACRRINLLGRMLRI